MGFKENYFEVIKKVNHLFWETNAFYIPFTLATITVLGAVMSSCIFNKKQSEYESQVKRKCCIVERKFDSNSNGMLDPDEAVKLARAIGYDRMLPTNNPIVRLEPGEYSKGDIRLVLSSSGAVHPAWSEEFRFPESKLESLNSSE